MESQSYFVAEMLQRLEQQLTILRPQAVQIATALGRDRYAVALEASSELTRALDAVVATTEILQDHIVAHDDLGQLGDALGELALRARGFVLVAQLDQLQAILAEPAMQLRTRGWFVGRFQSIADVNAFVRTRIDQIHGGWKPYRADQPALPGMTETERANIYRTMIRVAQRALGELSGDADLIRFLDSGAAATDLPDIHVPCKQIMTVLNLQIDTDAAQPAERKAARRVPLQRTSDPG